MIELVLSKLQLRPRKVELAMAVSGLLPEPDQMNPPPLTEEERERILASLPDAVRKELEEVK